MPEFQDNDKHKSMHKGIHDGSHSSPSQSVVRSILIVWNCRTGSCESERQNIPRRSNCILSRRVPRDIGFFPGYPLYPSSTGSVRPPKPPFFFSGLWKILTLLCSQYRFEGRELEEVLETRGFGQTPYALIGFDLDFIFVDSFCVCTSMYWTY
jgi:hypothetical protein